MKPIRLVACLTLAFHVSCAIGPNYKKPVVEVPEVYRGSLDSREAKSLADLAWWEIFEDPVLVELIETALNNNLNLEMAVARTEQAYRLSVATNSAFYPQVGYQGSAGKARSQNYNSPGSGVKYTSYMGAFNVAWEVDIWGRIRRSSESAKAQLLAAEEFQRGVLLSVVSNVATLYFALLELDRAHAIGVQAIEAFDETLTLFTRKYEGGIASRLEVTRAAAAEAQASAWLPEIEIEIAKVENTLSVLLGRPPGAIPRGVALMHQELPTLPAGLPSALLERRPDIRQAEEQVVSANAEVGVAMGNFLPRIGLVSMWGGSSQDLSILASGGSTSIWSIAGELSGPLFQGGFLYAQYKNQQALWEEAKANYELTALNAFSEVSTAITERRLRKDQRAAREREVKQLTESVNLSLIRYNQGLANYFEVLQAQQELFPAEFDLSEARLEERLAVIRLYLALGGGWQLGLNWLPEAEEPKEDPAPPSEPKGAEGNPPADDPGTDSKKDEASASQPS